MRFLISLALVLGSFAWAQVADVDTAAVDLAADSLAVDSVLTVVATDTLPPAVADTAAVPAGDTVVVETTVADTVVPAAVTVATQPQPLPELAPKPELIDLRPIGPIPMELSYGYKGFRWGSPQGTIPKMAYATALIYQDSLKATLSARLGLDVVMLTYFFADSGFWKIEIDFTIDQWDIDSQIDLFLRLEQSLAEIYGPPAKTNQIYSGPSPSYNGLMDVNFSRAFYRSTWSPIPVRIELLLNSLVQHGAATLPLFSGDHSILKLVYYNPDYMYYQPVGDQTEKLPSIFDIY